MKIEDLEEWDITKQLKTAKDVAHYIKVIGEEVENLEDFYWEVNNLINKFIKEDES